VLWRPKLEKWLFNTNAVYIEHSPDIIVRMGNLLFDKLSTNPELTNRPINLVLDVVDDIFVILGVNNGIEICG
jgi:hypothetical protein